MRKHTCEAVILVGVLWKATSPTSVHVWGPVFFVVLRGCCVHLGTAASLAISSYEAKNEGGGGNVRGRRQRRGPKLISLSRNVRLGYTCVHCLGISAEILTEPRAQSSWESGGGNMETSQWVSKHHYSLVTSTDNSQILLRLTQWRATDEPHKCWPSLMFVLSAFSLLVEAELCSLACFNPEPWGFPRIFLNCKGRNQQASLQWSPFPLLGLHGANYQTRRS